VAPIAAATLVVLTFWRANAEAFEQVVLNAGRFVGGRYSIADAYIHQEGWTGRMPFGAIYPGALGAMKIIGPGVRFWSLNFHAYCMVPGCDLEVAAPFVMSPRMFEVMLGAADRAKEILKSEGMNYFFVSTELQLGDWLPLSDLFSPEYIDKYIGVRWTDGTSYLLTWLGPGVAPLTADWIKTYSDQVSLSRVVRLWTARQMMSNLRSLDEQLKRNPPPRLGRDLVLPWAVTGGH
jgi:hypothetical protein